MTCPSDLEDQVEYGLNSIEIALFFLTKYKLKRFHLTTLGDIKDVISANHNY